MMKEQTGAAGKLAIIEKPTLQKNTQQKQHPSLMNTTTSLNDTIPHDSAQPPAPAPPVKKLLDISLLQLAPKPPEFQGNTQPCPLSVIIKAIASTESDSDNLLKQHPQFAFPRHYYKFSRTLGSGAFATVVEAEWLPRCSERVAVKMIEKRKARGDEISIKNEIDILCRVQHPHLLRLFDWGFGRKTIYMVTELARGGELFDRIEQNGHFYEFDAALVLYTVLDAVRYLHENDIIHRDLKPENVFMRDPKHRDYADILIGDFGLSKIVGGPKKKGGTIKFTQTRVGTCGYIAPEIILDEPYDFSCDIWSIGVISYVLLTGMAPYDGSGWTEELNDVMKHPLKYNEWFWDGISESAKDFTKRCLSIMPSYRPTAEEAMKHPWFARFPKTFRHNQTFIKDHNLPADSKEHAHRHRPHEEDAEKEVGLARITELDAKADELLSIKLLNVSSTASKQQHIARPLRTDTSTTIASTNTATTSTSGGGPGLSPPASPTQMKRAGNHNQPNLFTKLTRMFENMRSPAARKLQHLNAHEAKALFMERTSLSSSTDGDGPAVEIADGLDAKGDDLPPGVAFIKPLDVWAGPTESDSFQATGTSKTDGKE